MINPNKLKLDLAWWNQFPYELRLITKIRFFSSVGAGGVIYLTSLIFNNIGLSATEIGSGFATSAIVGTITRIITGNYLNEKNNIQLPLKILGFPDEYMVNGSQKDVLDYYKMSPEKIAEIAQIILK